MAQAYDRYGNAITEGCTVALHPKYTKEGTVRFASPIFIRVNSCGTVRTWRPWRVGVVKRTAAEQRREAA